MRFRVVLLFLTALSCSRGVQHPALQEGLLDMADTLTLGLDRYPGARLVEVASASCYANNVLLTHFRGQYYCMWQASARDEDTPDTRVLYAVSTDGLSWGEPLLLAAPTDTTFATPGGWINRADTLSAVINYVCSADRSQGGNAFFVSTADGSSWTVPRPLRMADGTPMQGILEQDPLLLPSGRTVGAAHFRPGLQPCPVYTDSPAALDGWHRAVFPPGEGKPLEPSQFRRPDGSLVMIFRDQASSFRKLASLSFDDGLSWSAPAFTDIPDSRSKQCAGNLPDGSAFIVWNPAMDKSRRLLAMAVSPDGVLFDRAWLLLGPSDLPPRQFPGRYKTLGYSYPKAFVESNALWIGFSVNKESVALLRLPL